MPLPDDAIHSEISAVTTGVTAPATAERMHRARESTVLNAWLKRSLALAALLVACGGCEEATRLAEASDEREANIMLDLLDSAQIRGAHKQAHKQQRSETWVLTIPAAQYACALRLLNDHGLPHKRPSGYDQLESGGPTQPEIFERASIAKAQEGEIEKLLLEACPGAVSAQANLALSAVSGSHNLGQKASAPITCAIAISVHGNAPQSAEVVERMKRLVAGSIDGLQPERVTLELVPYSVPRAAPPPPSTESPATTGGTLLARVALNPAIAGIGLALGLGLAGMCLLHAARGRELRQLRRKRLLESI